MVLIDEYDKPLLDVLDTSATMRDDNGNEVLIEDYNRNILKGFYSTFKAADADLRFVLLTGVTKFSQVSVFSGFNQPEDISMSRQFDALCGITEEEMEAAFGREIDHMAEEYGVSAVEMRTMLKRQYDGYHFSRRLIDIYNPFSVLNALKSGSLDDYWFASGTPTYLVRLLAHAQENLNELTGRYYDTRDFIDYRADVERPLPMIYQSGYLTIKGYDRLTGTYLLDFPNDEVKRGFATAVATGYLQPKSLVLSDLAQWCARLPPPTSLPCAASSRLSLPASPTPCVARTQSRSVSVTSTIRSTSYSASSAPISCSRRNSRARAVPTASSKRPRIYSSSSSSSTAPPMRLSGR